MDQNKTEKKLTREERLKMLEEAKQASQKRMDQVREVCKQAKDRLKVVYEKAAKVTGLTIEQLKNPSTKKWNLNEKDNAIFLQLRKIVNAFAIAKTSSVKASEEGAKKGSAARKHLTTKV